MNAIITAIASALNLVLQALRLRVRAAQAESDLASQRDATAARWRGALALGRLEDAIAARADHDALDAALKGAKPKNRKTRSPKR